MTRTAKGNQKRQYRGKKTRAEKPIEPPKDQSFEGGYSITFDHCVMDILTGQRTKVVSRKTVRFPSAIEMSEYYEQNRRKERRKPKHSQASK